MQLTFFALSRGTDALFLDRVELDPCGIVRIVGWSASSKVKHSPQVHLDRECVPFLHYYRVTRPDVDAQRDVGSLLQAGLVFEYLVPDSLASRRFESLSIQVKGFKDFRFEGAFEFLSPDYRGLFSSPQIYHRADIYGSGLPNTAIHPEIVALAKKLESPILDFGCGSGALITELRNAGLKACGLELNTETIRRSIQPAIGESITLYDGQFPSQFATASFRSVFCSEVLEHIPDFQSAVREIARLATRQVIFTVPDASAIPMGWRHALVPWHLLESTHVNFFNQKSLDSLLKPYFSNVEFGRVCPCNFNDSPFHVSLVASCFK